MFLELSKKQRPYDGMWEKIAKVRDYDNSYSYQTDTGQGFTYTPEKWITIGVSEEEPKI